MATHTLRREQFIPRPIEEVFPFFADARNLETLTPPWLNFKILTPSPIDMRAGVHLDYRLKWHGLPISWKTEILAWNPPHSFTDVQLRGPYGLWHHVHTFFSDPNGSRMVDVVTYRLPFGPLGDLAHATLVRRDLERVFDYRARVIASLFSPQSAGTRR
ncbi:MAG: cyclase/dehydrase [Candidatus Solibacter sp.]|jgi:ligand-binding SRPBCC domain-containing protein|nr:cyclase/dehydrase [Candidatus Solibacter sp.]